MIKMSEYAKRRKTLMQKIGPEGIVILPAADELSRNGDVVYPYRQHSDFYYLTGFSESGAMMLLAPKNKHGEFLLFNQVRNPEEEIWNGPRVGQAGARKDFLADQAYSIDEFKKMLPDLMVGRKTIYYPMGLRQEVDELMMQALRTAREKNRGAVVPTKLADISPFLDEMRLIKTPAEVTLMQKAVDITANAHILAMQACQPGMYEYELDALLSYEFKRQGALHVAYASIVGAGKNTCVLHYVQNNKKIVNGDLVLIDAGAEYENYAADITRTFPANGRYSPEQRAIYEIVLAAQLAAIKTIKPGSSWNAAQNSIIKVITQGLIDLGILKGRLNDLIEKKAYSPFYMHRSGHWLGLDVHDVGSYQVNGQVRALKSGMVLTVEPGIYLSSRIPGLAKRWHHIGVRIEDDVLVTAKGCKVLSQHIPKTIADIEAIMAR